MAEKSGKMSDEPEDKMVGGSDNMAERSEWKTEVEWQGKITEKYILLKLKILNDSKNKII